MWQANSTTGEPVCLSLVTRKGTDLSRFLTEHALGVRVQDSLPEILFILSFGATEIPVPVVQLLFG